MRNSKDTMPVRAIDPLERHGNRALKRIEIAAGRTTVHSTAKGRIAAMNHAIDILHNDRASLQGILDFLIVVKIEGLGVLRRTKSAFLV